MSILRSIQDKLIDLYASFINLFYQTELKNNKKDLEEILDLHVEEFENMNKNEMVRELNLRHVEHNKRQRRDELLDLLIKDERDRLGL